MSTLASEIKASINWLFQEPLALTTVGDASQLSYDDQISNGSAADQADTIWSDQPHDCGQRPRRSRSDRAGSYAVRLDADDHARQRQSDSAYQHVNHIRRHVAARLIGHERMHGAFW